MWGIANLRNGKATSLAVVSRCKLWSTAASWVSIDFLYRTTDLRDRIMDLRDKTVPPPPSTRKALLSEQARIRTLTANSPTNDQATGKGSSNSRLPSQQRTVKSSTSGVKLSVCLTTLRSPNRRTSGCLLFALRRVGAVHAILLEMVWLLVFFFDDFEMDPRFDV